MLGVAPLAGSTPSDTAAAARSRWGEPIPAFSSSSFTAWGGASRQPQARSPPVNTSPPPPSPPPPPPSTACPCPRATRANRRAPSSSWASNGAVAKRRLPPPAHGSREAQGPAPQGVGPHSDACARVVAAAASSRCGRIGRARVRAAAGARWEPCWPRWLLWWWLSEGRHPLGGAPTAPATSAAVGVGAAAVVVTAVVRVAAEAAAIAVVAAAVAVVVVARSHGLSATCSAGRWRHCAALPARLAAGSGPRRPRDPRASVGR